jgi:hypothetical protein
VNKVLIHVLNSIYLNCFNVKKRKERRERSDDMTDKYEEIRRAYGIKKGRSQVCNFSNFM